MTLTDMVIENFCINHLDGVEKIEKACFSHPWSRDDLKKQLSLDTSHFIVALDGDTVAGYMGLQIFSHEGYVTNIAVLPQFRRRGIANALLAHSFENDMDFITLEVRQSNFAAIALYEKSGFENMGVRPHFYSDPDENAVIMTKYFTENA